MIRINPTKMLVGGNQKAAKNFLKPARSQLEILKNQMSFQNLSQGIRRIWLNEDVYIECRKIFNYQECRIWVRPLIEAVREKVLTSFILIISSQSEQEAFAWNISTNAILTDDIGDPMTVDTLDNVKDFVKEYIRREEYEGMLDDDDIDPKQLKPSDTYYESWWTCDIGDTVEATGPFVFTGYSWPEYGEMMDWPEYYTLDQNKSEPDDFVCEGSAKFLRKVDRFVPYLGVTIGHDPAFYHNSGETFPLYARGNIERDTYDGENTLYPKFLWMTPYLSYQDPDTEVEFLEKGALIHQKQGGHHITQGIIPPEIQAKCGGYETEQYARSLFWLHSVFGFPACTEVGCYAASQLNLDMTIDILFDTWDADCHYSLLEHSDTNISCTATSWPYMDFGLEQNDNGAVVFEFCVVCWGLASESLSWDERYLSASTGERKQIFRLWTSQREQLGVFADAIWQAHNVIRDAQDLQRFSINAKLIEAAQRHADDLIANDLYGHVGSDGSSVEDRAEDANYLLWKNEYQFSNVGENVLYTNQMDVTSQKVMDEWVASPGHYSNIIHEDFTEIGIGIASNGVDIIQFVVVFGVLDGRWPGFAPLDTTDMLTYINSNFVWSGTEDYVRVPKLFLV